tara:strand:- start:6817 stop:7962 length:1146 start_codon:yes stop_codon:yes gene_type:complete
MSTIIRTRSPFFIRTPQETDSELNYFQINITVFGGLSSSTEQCDDLYATYSLQKKPLGSEDSVSVDISEIVNDHIVQVFTGVYSASAYKQSIWVTVATSPRQADGSLVDGASITSNTYLAQEGYNHFKDGANYTTEPVVMLSGTHFEYHEGSRITIPVNVEQATSLQWKRGAAVIQTDSVTDNGNQNQKIRYVQYTNTSAVEVDSVIVYYGDDLSTTLTLKRISECKYPVNKLSFVNRWGATQDLFFFKKSTDSLDSKSENFNASIFKARSVHLEPPEEGPDCQETITYNTYSTTAHAKKTFNSNATESVSLNTGFVSELTNVYFEELMVSEYIWLTDSTNTIYPVNLKDSSFTYKTGLNDRLINYTMNFEKSFSLVNNIR